MRLAQTKYRIFLDDSYQRPEEKQWYEEIRSRKNKDNIIYGTIYKFNNELLAVSSESEYLCHKFRDMELQQHNWFVYLFPFSRLDEIAKMIVARTRRTISPEQRQKLITRLATWQRNQN